MFHPENLKGNFTANCSTFTDAEMFTISSPLFFFLIKNNLAKKFAKISASYFYYGEQF